MGIKRNWKLIQEFGDTFGLTVNAAKCGYTYRATSEEPSPLMTKSPTGEDVEVPMLRGKDHYRYLGIWISMDLTWNKTIEEYVAKHKKIAELVRVKRWLKPEQRLRVMNMIAGAAIRYSAKIVPWPKDKLAIMDAAGRYACTGKKNLSKNYCHMSEKDGGRGIEPLAEIANETFASALLYNGIFWKSMMTECFFDHPISMQS